MSPIQEERIRNAEHTVGQQKQKINGKAVRVRPVKQSDVILIDQMHDRLSKDSLYFRYLGTSKPSMQALKEMCAQGSDSGMVFVAEVNEPQIEIVALALYCQDQNDPHCAEPAVLVEDRFQGFGLGKMIMSHLFRDAVKKGIRSFVSYIHPFNDKVLGLIKSTDMEFQSKFSLGLKKVIIELPEAE